jgi:hypothetical protein
VPAADPQVSLKDGPDGCARISLNKSMIFEKGGATAHIDSGPSADGSLGHRCCRTKVPADSQSSQFVAALGEPLDQFHRHRLFPAQHASDVWPRDAEQPAELDPPANLFP